MTPGAVVVAVVLGLGWIFFLYRELNIETRARKHYQKLFDAGLEVCGFTWCKEPLESIVHAPHDSTNDKTHAYIPARLIAQERPIIRSAWKDAPLTFANEIKRGRR